MLQRNQLRRGFGDGMRLSVVVHRLHGQHLPHQPDVQHARWYLHGNCGPRRHVVRPRRVLWWRLLSGFGPLLHQRQLCVGDKRLAVRHRRQRVQEL